MVDVWCGGCLCGGCRTIKIWYRKKSRTQYLKKLVSEKSGNISGTKTKKKKKKKDEDFESDPEISTPSSFGILNMSLNTRLLIFPEWCKALKK